MRRQKAGAEGGGKSRDENVDIRLRGGEKGGREENERRGREGREGGRERERERVSEGGTKIQTEKGMRGWAGAKEANARFITQPGKENETAAG